MRNIFDTPEKKADIAIVGLGPAGLATCIEAARHGMSIVAFTNRRVYSRGQRIKPSLFTLTFLDALDLDDADDRLFFDKFDSDKSIQTKDIESYLHRKLAPFSHLITLVDINEQNPITTIQTTPRGQDTHLSLLDGTRYYFTNLVGADGIKRTTSSLVRKGLHIPVDYKDCNLQDRHLYHASVQLCVNQHQEASDIPPKSQAELGWDNHVYTDPEPMSLILPNLIGTESIPTKFSYTGEIPKDIYDKTGDEQEALLKLWAITAILKEYNHPSLATQLDFRKSAKKEHDKQKIQAVPFKLHQTMCTQSLFKLPHGGHYAPIGDARRTPYYKLSHGINDAILTGVSFVRSIKDEQVFDESAYLAVIDTIDQAIDAGYGYDDRIYETQSGSDWTDTETISSKESMSL